MAVTGTTDNLPAGAGASGAAQPTISHGTADAAMVAAAMASESASSAEGAPVANTGDTPELDGDGNPVATAAATVQPGQAVPPAKPAGSGEAPEHRIQAAVRNARTEVMTRFGLSEQTNPEDVQTSMTLLQRVRANPVRFAQDILNRLRGDSGSGGTAPAEDKDEELPAADLVSRDGSMKTYSEGSFKKALEINTRNVIRQMGKEMAPLKEFVTGEQDRRQGEEQASQRRAELSDALTEFRTWPHVTKESEPQILEKLRALPIELRRNNPRAALGVAYAHFMRDGVLPTVEAESDKRVRASFTKKAATSVGSASPVSTSATGKAPTLRNQSDLAKHMEEMERSMTST